MPELNITVPARLRTLWSLLEPPATPDAERNRVARILQFVAAATFVGIIVSISNKVGVPLRPGLVILSVELVVTALVIVMNKRGMTTAASFLFTVSFVLAAAALSFFNDGLRDIAGWMFPALLLLAGLFLRSSHFTMVTAVAVTSIGVLYVSEVQGWLTPVIPVPVQADDFMDAVLIMSVSALAVGGVTQYLRNLVRESARKEDLLEDANRELEERAERLRNSEALWRSIVESAPTIIMTVSGAGIIEFTNDRRDTVFAFSSGRWLEELLAEEYRGLYRDALTDVLTTGTTRRLEVAVAREGGGSRWYALIIGPIYRSTVIEDVTVLALDINDVKLQENRIRSLNEQLEARVASRTSELQSALNELESFSYSVSHDLRAPLRHIAGYAEMARMDMEQGKADSAIRNLATVNRSAVKLGSLVDELLAFSRIGRSEFRSMRLDLGQLVDEVWADLHQERKGRSIRWRREALPVVMGDPLLLRQVFANLLSNAVKFTRKRADAEISVAHSTGDGRHIVTVRDNGAGFDMTYADKLFGVFQRLHAEEDFEGTGIGLANVKRIVQRHGGQVWAEGEEDRGAAFHVALPASGGTIISPGETA